MHSPERLIEVYEAYTLLCSRIVAEYGFNSNSNLEKKATELYESLLDEFLHFDISELTIGQAKCLGMEMSISYASLNNTSENLMMFPVWMTPIIPNNLELTDEFGTEFQSIMAIIHSSHYSHQDGMLAFGMLERQFMYRCVLVEKKHKKYRH